MVWMRGAMIITAALLSAQSARADLPACGVDCITETRVVLCNDSASTTIPSTISCTPTLCEQSVVCGTFENIPAAAYPLLLKGVWVVMGPSSFSSAFALEVYTETGTATPGPRIAPGAPNNFAIAGNPTAFTRIPGNPPPGPNNTDLPSSFLINSGDFRVCIRKTLLDDIPDVCHDADGFAGPNWAFSGQPGVCFSNPFWRDSGSMNYSGDFIIRAEIEPASMAPFGGISVCTPPDAGVVDTGPVDTGLMDTGAVDTGAIDPDAGELDFGLDASEVDMAPLADIGASQDSGQAPDVGESIDTGAVDRDAGPTEPGGPPEIQAITPVKGPSSAPVQVTVIGRGFIEGLSLQLSSNALLVDRLAGDTTIISTVPEGLTPGVYDVLVTNPDGQAAILKDAYEVEGGGPPASGQTVAGCGCGSVHGPDTRPNMRGGLWLFAICLTLTILRSQRGSRR